MSVAKTVTGVLKAKLVTTFSLKDLAKILVLTIFVTSVFVLAGHGLAAAANEKAETGSEPAKSDGISNTLFNALFGNEEEPAAAKDETKDEAAAKDETKDEAAAKESATSQAKEAAKDATKTEAGDKASKSQATVKPIVVPPKGPVTDAPAGETKTGETKTGETKTGETAASEKDFDPCAETPSSKSPFRVNKSVSLDPSCGKPESDESETAVASETEKAADKPASEALLAGDGEEKSLTAEGEKDADKPEEKSDVKIADKPEDKPVAAKDDKTSDTTVVASIDPKVESGAANANVPSKDELQALLRATPETETARLEEVLAALESNPGSEDDVFMVVRYLSRRDKKYKVRLGAFFDPTDSRKKGTVIPNVKYAYDEYAGSGQTEGRERIDKLVEWSKTDAAKGAEGLNEFIAATK
ncbi:MAG: hypothetical protein LBF38_02445 [Deltaproteobacteria bacterium]|jgi:hypothetical protein|nr:hypothetical protein [Deltaproteobacteria bacterium]